MQKISSTQFNFHTNPNVKDTEPLQFVTGQPPLEPGLQWDFLQPIRREIEIGESAATTTENQS